MIHKLPANRKAGYKQLRALFFPRSVNDQEKRYGMMTAEDFKSEE